MEWPKRARTADWENGVLALDREKQFEVPKLTAEIMERLAGYTLVGFHVKEMCIRDSSCAEWCNICCLNNTSLKGFLSSLYFSAGSLIFTRMVISCLAGVEDLHRMKRIWKMKTVFQSYQQTEV